MESRGCCLGPVGRGRLDLAEFFSRETSPGSGFLDIFLFGFHEDPKY